MARFFSASASVREHFEFGCPTRVEIVPVTPERDCQVDLEACSVQHSRQCDECGVDMTLSRRSCEHARLSTHRCPRCGRTRQYGGSLV